MEVRWVGGGAGAEWGRGVVEGSELAFFRLGRGLLEWLLSVRVTRVVT